MNVPLLDLSEQYASLREDVDGAVAAVIKSQQFILGPVVESFEANVADYLGATYALGVSSGTDALLLSLMALGIGSGDEVIVPTFSFFATAGVVVRLGAIPVFAEIDPASYTIDAEQVEGLITERTRAIIPVHLFGQGADLESLVKICERHGLALIEDAAQSIGAVDSGGRPLGTVGTAGCFSFFPSKNLGAFGDAGLVVTNDADLYQRMKLMRVHGAEGPYRHQIIGGNFRMDALQAAVLDVKLPRLDGWNLKRRQNAAIYRQLFLDAGLALKNALYPTERHPVALPSDRSIDMIDVEGEKRDSHIYHQFVIRASCRDELKEWLLDEGVGCAVYYPVPFHLQECFRNLPSRTCQFPHAERGAKEVLALPIYPELTEEQIRTVVRKVESFYLFRNGSRAAGSPDAEFPSDFKTERV